MFAKDPTCIKKKENVEKPRFSKKTEYLDQFLAFLQFESLLMLDNNNLRNDYLKL